MFINVTLSISDETIPLSLTEINFYKNEKFTDFLHNISKEKDDYILDDFKDIFNPIATRIIYISLWIIYLTLSNSFYALVILYEKYGEDIMKRSINNQLWSQVSLAMILYNCVCSTIFSLRFIFGPLHFTVAAFESCIANSWMSWTLLVLAEISVIKALLICKFSWNVRINEHFAGRFLLRFNLGYILISHTARFVNTFFMQFKFYLDTFFLNLTFPWNFLLNFRYFIGSFFDSRQFQLLSGIKIKPNIRGKLYVPIYVSIIVLTSTIAFIITNIKKMKERYKEWKFHQNINLNEQQPYEGQLPMVNNVKNNVPLFNGFQIALVVGFVLASMITFWSLDYAFNDSKHFYKQFLFKTFTLVYIYNIVIPLIYLTKKKKMRKYFWKYVSDVMF